jgi:hypothetical protein
VAFFIRPEAIIIAPDAGLDDFNRLAVTIKSILFDGANSRLLATPVNGDAELMIALPQNRQYDHLAAGDRIDIGWSARSASCFKVIMNDLPRHGSPAFLHLRHTGAPVAVSAHRPAPHRSAADVLPHRRRFRGHGLEPGQLPEFFQRAGLLEHLRAHRRLRHSGHLITFAVSLPVAFYITKVVSPRYQWFSQPAAAHAFLGQRTGAGLRVDDPAAGKRCHQPFSAEGRPDAAPVEMLYNDITMVMGLVYTSMLFMVVPLISVLESLDDSLIEAAYDLGGNVFSIVTRIIIPHAMPGIVSGASWCSCSPWATT